MEKIIINIANEYTKTPGGRFIKDGPFSGEDFRINKLKPAFEEAQKSGKILEINFDGGYGYAISFLEEAFGGLARETKNEDVMKIKLISSEEPTLIDKIQKYMKEAILNPEAKEKKSET